MSGSSEFTPGNFVALFRVAQLGLVALDRTLVAFAGENTAGVGKDHPVFDHAEDAREGTEGSGLAGQIDFGVERGNVRLDPDFRIGPQRGFPDIRDEEFPLLGVAAPGRGPADDKDILVHQFVIGAKEAIGEEQVALLRRLGIEIVMHELGLAVTPRKLIILGGVPGVPGAPAGIAAFDGAGDGVGGLQEVFGLGAANPVQFLFHLTVILRGEAETGIHRRVRGGSDSRMLRLLGKSVLNQSRGPGEGERKEAECVAAFHDDSFHAAGGL